MRDDGGSVGGSVEAGSSPQVFIMRAELDGGRSDESESEDEVGRTEEAGLFTSLALWE